MIAANFRSALARVGYSQRGFARLVGANERTVRRWVDGEQDVPQWVEVMLDLMLRLHAVEAQKSPRVNRKQPVEKSQYTVG